MTPKHHKLLELFRERFCDEQNMDSFTYVSADDVMMALWSLNETFRPKLHQIRTVRYHKQYEKQADLAIENYALLGERWGQLPLVVQRVLLERHMQAIILCVANNSVGNDVIVAPTGMSLEMLTRYSVLFLYYSMKLPYPVKEELTLDLDGPIPARSDLMH